MKLEISLFKFDKDSDYLPYYTKHFLKVTNEKNLLDILNTINEEQPFRFENSQNFDLVVNGVYLKAGITIEELVSNFGKELTLEPISIRRAYHDFLIDENDFISKLDILKNYTNEEDKAFYFTLKQYFYASNTLNYESDYIGDAILILASRVIEDRPIIKENVLKVLSEQEIGASFHTSLKNRIHNYDLKIEEAIHALQEELGYKESIEKQNFRKNTTLILDFGEFEKEYEVKHDFKDFNIAYYTSQKDEEAQTLLSKLNAKVLDLESLKLDVARTTFNANPKITYQTTSTILLDAFDNNADFILVDNTEDFYIFDYNRKQIEKLCGREILIPVLHKNELQKLATGKHSEVKKTLSKHQVNPEIIG
jgi:hypothetical protein